MPRSKVKRAKGELTVTEAAAKVGASAAAVRNWMKQEARLKKALRRQDDVWLFDASAVKILESIREDRFKNAPASLKQAWAKRKAGAGKKAARAEKALAAPAAKGAPAARGKKAVNPGLQKAWAARRRNAALRRAEKARNTGAVLAATSARVSSGVSGDAAAKLVGITKVRLYQVLKKLGIKKPRTPRSFTPEIIDRVKGFVADSRGAARAAGRKVAPMVREAAATSDRLYAEAIMALRHAQESTNQMAREFRDSVREMMERQAAMMEQAMRTVRMRLASEE